LEQAIDILTANVRKASQGDANARAMLYSRFSQKMFSICVRMSGNRTDAEDLLQDGFIQAFNNLKQLKDYYLFEPWLRKIIINECIRHVKRSSSWQQLDEEMMDISDNENIDWIKDVNFEQIHQEIKNLPGGCREIFNLYVIEDYSHQQIAGMLNISVSTSKSQYHRARKLLKERLKQFADYG